MRLRWILAGMVLLALVFAAGYGAFFSRAFFHHPPLTPLIRSERHSKALYLALMEFDRNYGSFPSIATAELIKDATRQNIPVRPVTSNDYFRQLLAAGFGNEKMDEVPPPGAKGERGFAYVPGLSSTSRPDLPILIAPLVAGTDRIDPAFGEKGVILRVDGSAEEARCDQQGHVLVFGRRLLDPENPIWDGKPPLIAWPE